MEEFVSINPKYVRLQGRQDQELSQRVVITPNKKYPFRITAVSTSDDKIAASLEKGTPANPDAYSLLVTGKATEPGRHSSNVTLMTDSNDKPQLTVRVHMYLQPARDAQPSAPQAGNAGAEKTVKN